MNLLFSEKLKGAAPLPNIPVLSCRPFDYNANEREAEAP
jgi:hypothetical protein